MGLIIEDKIVMKRINEIRPYIRNPRMNGKTVELLCDLIPKVGFNVPIVIDKKGVIVKGHARFSAAIRLGMEEVPCIVTHASPEEIKADRIMDNKISEYSEFVDQKVLEEIRNLDLDIDFTKLGFAVEKEKKANFSEANEANGNSENGKKYYKAVCLHCGHVYYVDADTVEG